MKDFSLLLADPRFPHLEVHVQSTIYYWAGVAYKRDNQASKIKEYLEKAISVAPESYAAQRAEKELKELSVTSPIPQQYSSFTLKIFFALRFTTVDF